MATRSQRKKEKHKQKRKKKKEQSRKRQGAVQQKTEIPSGSSARHRQRLSRQVPQAWPGEMPEDVAVFDDAVLETLPEETAGEVAAVREALEWASDSRGEDALKRTSPIPRSSPLSEWRLFVRGLVDWLAEATEAANEAWKRLNPERRPGRIATSLMNSLRTDLDQLSAAPKNDGPVEESQTDWLDRLDDQLLYHAKLLRRVRFDRAAIKIAESGLRTPEESKELTLGPRKIRWLKRFASEYRETEPDLTAAFEQVALHRAFAQNYSDLFEEAARSFQGPRHDRRNLLLSFFYFSRFESRSIEEDAERRLNNYLQKDLPQNQELSEPLRAAIASQIHLNEAEFFMRPHGGGMMDFLFGPAEDPKSIRKHLKDSIKAYPANRAAYKAYAEWVESKLDNDRLTKPKRKPFENELAQVMRDWAKGLPDDVRPRLWLVDYLLENEETEQAKPHVDWLAASRQDDPRVRATPWKWELLEAMRLCRRKAWLAHVPAHLEKAETLWPAWLSKQWLPYLKAAWLLRAGQIEEYEAERKTICEASGRKRDSLADACMMLGAAQHMRVPAADLKPLRTPIDQTVKNLKKVSDEELLDVSGFFWDLYRTQLQYPAYRMHGGKIINELFACLRENRKLVLEHYEEERIQVAVLLCSEHRCFINTNSYDIHLPSWYSKSAISRHPMFAAAKLNSFLKLRFQRDAANYRELGSLLRESAQTVRNPYYRYWFNSLADELDDVLAKNASGPFGSRFNPFGGMFDDDDEDEDYDDDDDDDDEEDLGFDWDCDCPDCTAARRAYEASH